MANTKKKAKKKATRSGKPQPRKQGPGQKHTQHHQPLQPRSRLMGTWLASGLSLVVAVLGVQVFFARPSIVGTSSGTSQPLALVFTITNDSTLLPITQIRYDCVVDEVVTANGNRIRGQRMRPRQSSVRSLGPKESSTAYCDSLVGLEGSSNVQGASIGVSITYFSPPWPLSRTTDAQVAAVVDDGDAPLTVEI